MRRVLALKQRGSYVKIRKITVRARLKIHSRNLHASLRDIFVPNSVAVAHYAAFIWGQIVPTKCDAQLLKAILNTHQEKNNRFYKDDKT